MTKEQLIEFGRMLDTDRYFYEDCYLNRMADEFLKINSEKTEDKELDNQPKKIKNEWYKKGYSDGFYDATISKEKINVLNTLKKTK